MGGVGQVAARDRGRVRGPRRVGSNPDTSFSSS